MREHNTAGPYLIAGPLATLGNWIKEFHKWLPSCPVVLYHGTKEERAEIRRKKMPINQQKTLDFPIVITSFELCIADRNFLEKYVWQYIILDEGHRIKNRNCRLIRDLKTFQSTSRLLLTGTPIQNSLEELWSLLNFCSPMIFDDLDVFKSWFGFRNIGSETRIEDILDEEQRDQIVTKLHDILRPFVLRRMKKDTLKDLVVEKKEVVVYCAMSSLQREFYQCVLDGNLRELLIEMGIPRAKSISQINTMMNLRKICNHPYLFGDFTQAFQENGDNAQLTAAQAKRMERLFITASGKFRLLDRMLPRLLDEGHKVILFSQMTEVLNLIEDYLAFREINWVRLDGATKLDERQEAIDRFNAPDSDVQIFLLSTRAGGLGINLTAADTAILFDSDWNPHMDAQAQSRCHRIGQTQNVVVYRLLTMASVEIDMMKKQLSKKKLERLAIEGGEFGRAGERATRRKRLEVDDLKRLLMDDVRRLGMNHHTITNSIVTLDSDDEERGEENIRKNKNRVDSGASTIGVLDDITDKELDMIMDRERLFAVPSSAPAAASTVEAKVESVEDTPSANASPLTAVSRSSRTNLASPEPEGSGKPRSAKKEDDTSTRSTGKRKRQSLSGPDGMEDEILAVGSGPIPIEGLMYDIVQDCGGFGILEDSIV